MRRWAKLAVLLLWSPGLVEAGEMDFRLGARTPAGEGILFDCARRSDAGECTSYAPRNGRFRTWVGQLGAVIAPRMATPARTLGHAGFQVAAMWTGSFVPSDEPQWGVTDGARATGAPSGLVQSLQLDVRKGLPHSFEVGAHLQWLVDSELFAPGLELRWAPVEGYEDWPDIGLRAAVSHLVGNRDMSLTALGFEGLISKPFALFGMVDLTPYAGWSMWLSSARSRVIDPTPAATVGSGAMGDPVRADFENDFVFDSINLGDLINHRLTVGARLQVYVVDVTVQGEFQLVGDTTPVHSLSAKFGLDF